MTDQTRRRLEARLPFVAVFFVLVAVVVVVIAPRGTRTVRLSAARHSATATATAEGGSSVTTASSRSTQGHTHTVTAAARPPAKPHRKPRAAAAPSNVAGIAKEIGQLIISTYQGTSPPQTMLDAVRAGQTGAVILMGDNTAGGVASTRAAVNALQAAARAGHNPGLLIMTDQEGGEVKRLIGPPDYAAAQMGNATLAYQQGVETGQLLKQAGVNVDLAPVADVTQVNGFMAQEQRTFGASAAVVAQAACAFAMGLKNVGVGYTLKHFPGLGDAINSTDNEPVAIDEPAPEIEADDQAYRDCGNDAYASVMVSSASYPQLTGSTPAVLSRTIYRRVLPADGIVNTLTMSDSFESGAINGLVSPAMTAINAGLDMVMYPGIESASAAAYATLLQDADRGALSSARVGHAAGAVLALKRTLELPLG